MVHPFSFPPHPPPLPPTAAGLFVRLSTSAFRLSILCLLLSQPFTPHLVIALISFFNTTIHMLALTCASTHNLPCFLPRHLPLCTRQTKKHPLHPTNLFNTPLAFLCLVVSCLLRLRTLHAFAAPSLVVDCVSTFNRSTQPRFTRIAETFPHTTYCPPYSPPPPTPLLPSLLFLVCAACIIAPPSTCYTSTSFHPPPPRRVTHAGATSPSPPPHQQ